jgi:adenosylmethionine-8-amino-7-oxononanoate aminotransferase
VARQLKRIAHSSALGLANEPAAHLAERLITAANASGSSTRSVSRAPASSKRRGLVRVFFSDDGATALEVAVKLAYEFTRRTRGQRQPRFLSLQGAYHGDTLGAASVGQIDLFRRAYAGLLFKSDQVMAPYCYRCPFNRARPERADARVYRRCRWECVDKFEEACTRQAKRGAPYAGFVFEPLLQGAAGMIPQPPGWLKRVTEIARAHRTLLIADEVMTGFGRATNEAGSLASTSTGTPPLFACQEAGVTPDLLSLAKGMTGGYLPMAATLVTNEIFQAFLGKYEDCRSFFHGHSYTGNQLGAAASLASLDLLQSPQSARARVRLQRDLAAALSTLWAFPNVGDIRQVGLVAGVELVRDWRTRAPFELRERVGIRVCEAMARRGVLTRPIGNVIVLMPPYCTTTSQVETMVAALRAALREVES